MAKMSDYDQTDPVTFEAQSAPEVVETVEIEGRQVAIVRYATLEMPTQTSTPVFGRTVNFYAMFADAKVHPLSVCFYVNTSQYHQAGDALGGHTVAAVKGGELARAATVKAAVKAARERIERDRLFAQYAPVAEKNIGSHTRADFDALPEDAEIEPGDLVVVVSHSKFRTGVAVKVTKTRVECLAATPTGGRANGATRTKGTQVRLLRKATPATPAAPAGATEADRIARVVAATGRPVTIPAPAPAAGAAPAAPAAVADVDGRRFGAGALVEVVDGSCSASIVGAARELLAEVTGWRGRVVAVDADAGRGEWAKLDFEGRPGGLVLWADRVRVIDEGGQDAAPVLDEAEDRRAAAGRVFARVQGMGDAGDGSTLYRMTHARVGCRQVRIHDAGGEQLGAVAEFLQGWRGAGFRAVTPAGAVLPGGPFGTFGEAVAAVRAAAAEQDDDQGATVAAREGEDMGQTETPAADPAEPTHADLLAKTERDRVELRDARTDLLDVRGILSPNGSLFPPVPPSISLVPAVAPAVRWLVDELERVRAELAELRSDPATLRAVADQVERGRAGHVTEIEVDGAGHFAWRCVQGDAEQTGLEVGEEAYRAATAHGPLAADSPFVRGPVIVHQGRGDNEHGVPRRTLAGSLRFEPFDGGLWFLPGYASTDEIEEEDEGIVAAQAWAAGLMAHPGYGEPSAVVVARWEHHRDDHGDWWEPVTR